MPVPDVNKFCEALAEACDVNFEYSVPHERCWAIVTALRGPDFLKIAKDDTGLVGSFLYSDTIKAATTAVIRYKIFPKARNCAFGLYVTRPDSEELVEVRKELSCLQWTEAHFIGHAKTAFKALGLEWNAVNIIK